MKRVKKEIVEEPADGEVHVKLDEIVTIKEEEKVKD